MKEIKVQESVGQVLGHDITQIIPGVKKGPVFKKGHIIKEEDIPVLLSVGKEHIFVYEYDENMVHENDAATMLADMCGNEHMYRSEVSEGKIELFADTDGIFVVDNELLNIVNSFGQMMIATRASGFLVKKGDKLAGTRIIPLVIEKEKMNKVQSLIGDRKIMKVVPLKEKKFGLVVTGSEVFKGRIQDAFTPVLVNKMKVYGATMSEHVICDDKPDEITKNILEFLKKGVDLVLVTGGMSVDPDDKTPLAIKNTGAKIVSYGAPVLPGAMFLLSYMSDGRSVLGLPGCVMYAKRTIFDLVIPRILADIKVDEKFLNGLGNGGLCLNCPVCTFPNCGFGKSGN